MTQGSDKGGTMRTENLRLIAVEQVHVGALTRGKRELAEILGVTMPDGWPHFPEAFSRPAGGPRRSERRPTEWPGYFFVHPRERALVGNGGFAGAPDDSGAVEIGYEIAPEYRNRGFATEAARAMIDHAFAHEDVVAVVAHTLAGTNASGSVLRKAGMSFVAETDDPEVGKTWRWRITRDEHRRRSAGRAGSASVRPGLDPKSGRNGTDRQKTRRRFDASQGPRVLGRNDGKAVDLGSLGVRFLVWSEESGGGFSLVEHPIPARTLATPLHRHAHEDEYSYVLEGRLGRGWATRSCVRRRGTSSSSPEASGTPSGTRATGHAGYWRSSHPAASSTCSRTLSRARRRRPASGSRRFMPVTVWRPTPKA